MQEQLNYLATQLSNNMETYYNKQQHTTVATYNGNSTFSAYS